MPESFGKKTHHVLHKAESHKLHESFSVLSGGDVRVGMPVKLVTTEDFTVAPLAAADNKNLCIGVAIHDTAFAEAAANSVKNTYDSNKVTVMMKAFTTVMGATAAAAAEPIVPGPVKFLGFVAGTSDFPQKGVNTFVNCLPTDVLMIGWALEEIAELTGRGQIALAN